MRRSTRPRKKTVPFNLSDYPSDNEESEDLELTAQSDMYESESEADSDLEDFIVSDDENSEMALSEVRRMIMSSAAARALLPKLGGPNQDEEDDDEYEDEYEYSYEEEDDDEDEYDEDFEDEYTEEEEEEEYENEDA